MTMRFSWPVALALGTSVVFTPSWADELWLQDPITGCEIWTDEIDPAGELVSWDGRCVGGKASGNGTLSWFRGGKLLGRYSGGMAFGRLHGVGVMHYAAEEGYNRYEGEFVNGELLGPLVYEGANGDRFEGVVEDDGRKGVGVFVDAEGEWYEGEIFDGLYHGEGILILEEGGQLQGNFVAGKAQGAGVLISEDGTAYEANFIEGKIDGKVNVTHPDGTQEEQLWKMDQPVESSTAEEKQS
jgi:hypothetical protein